MRVSVKIDDRLFEVDIASLHARPVVAVVEGERFEVWPEAAYAVPVVTPAGRAPTEPPRSPPVTGAVGGDARRSTVHAIQAPIPGVIVSVAVEAGGAVDVGQEVCVLEAMKMKNSIRAPRAGYVGRVAVEPGTHVQHHDVLIEYAD